MNWHGRFVRYSASPSYSSHGRQPLADATFIRSRDDCEWHLEVRVGNVETEAGGR
jgi:hypothetical protein